MGMRCTLTTDEAAIAFFPLFGAFTVMLWSINRSGALSLLLAIPIVGQVFAIWLYFTVPTAQGRTRWWALLFWIPGAFYYYSFTLPDLWQTNRSTVPAQ